MPRKRSPKRKRSKPHRRSSQARIRGRDRGRRIHGGMDESKKEQPLKRTRAVRRPKRQWSSPKRSRAVRSPPLRARSPSMAPIRGRTRSPPRSGTKLYRTRARRHGDPPMQRPSLRRSAEMDEYSPLEPWMPGFWDEYEKNTKRAREAKKRWDAWTKAAEADYWLSEAAALGEMDKQGAELEERIGRQLARLSPRPSIDLDVEVVRPHQIEIMNPRRGQAAQEEYEILEYEIFE